MEQQIVQTIQATVELVHQNGIQYEQFLRNIHKDNPLYDFLRPSSPYYHYYLTQLAETLRPVAQVDHSGWADNKRTKVYLLEEMSVGTMANIVKEAVRKGMQPYSTLAPQDIASFSKIQTGRDNRQVVKDMLKFVEQQRNTEKKQKESEETARKLQAQRQMEQSRKELRKTMDLPGRVLTNEMGISNDGTVSGGVPGRYSGLGRTEDSEMYGSFRKGEASRR